MAEQAKLNLRALKKAPESTEEIDTSSVSKKTEKKDLPLDNIVKSEDTPQTPLDNTTPENNSHDEPVKSSKISLGMIKKAPVKKEQEEKKTQEKENAINKASPIWDSSKKEDIHQDIPIIKKESGEKFWDEKTKNTWWINKLENPKYEEKTIVETMNKEEKKWEESDEKVEFQNYESTFKKKSSNVLKHLQNFHYSPKTRLWLILWLITFSICIVGGLMIFSPEQHSLSIYKASILEIYQSNIKKKTTPIEEIITTPKPDIPIEENINNKEENKQEALPDIHTEQDQKERLRQHLLKKYSSH